MAAGDAAAVRECIDRYGGLLRSLVRRKGLTDADAEDLVQEIFVELWRNAASFDERIASETTFVAMIARRRLIDRLRATTSRARLESRFAKERGTGDERSAAEPGAEVETADDTAAAREALQMLSEVQRETLLLAVVQGKSHADIARLTDTPLGTVKTNVRRGLIRLREILDARKRGHAQGEGA